MSIKFNCPHCKKVLKVKEELAGKRARCPGCKQVLTIPEPRPAAEVEELAAAALADEPKPAGPIPEPTTMEFRCYYCDEEVQVGAELAGKQTPCPHCRRIIKVPQPVKDEPTDWRKVETRGPAGARREEEPAPEGAWGTSTATGRVSAEALLEAEAIPVIRERVTVRQWIVRGFAVAGCLALIAVGIWGTVQLTKQRHESKALKLALQCLAEGSKKRPGADAAAVALRGLGEYYIRADKPNEARQHLQRARSEALKVKAGSAEPDALLIDLALAQVDLGGDQDQLLREARLRWDLAHREVRQTLQNLRSSEARAQALRQVGRKLIAKGQVGIATTLPHELSEQEEAPEMLAVVGLELYRADRAKEAGDLAEEALGLYESKPAAGGEAKPRRLPLAPSLVALLLALKQSAHVLAPVPSGGDNPPAEVRAGYAQGWVYQGKLDEARALANGKGPALERLQANIAVASAHRDPAAARPDIETAVSLVGEVKARSVSPWMLLRLVRLGVRAGLAERVQPVADVVPDADLRSRAQLEVLLGRLGDKADADKLAEAAKQKPSHPLTLQALARHNACYSNSSAVLKMVEGWEPETLRLPGYVGVALGVQDSGQ